MADKWLVPKRAVPLTIVGSNDINENWRTIEQALNETYVYAIDSQTKIPLSEKGEPGGVPTLDDYAKVTEVQLPDKVFGHVFSVNSLYEQLALTAYPGDLCYREDIKKTYALMYENPTIFSSWLEVSAADSGGEVGGNPPYTNRILSVTHESDMSQGWVYDLEKELYRRTYGANEHGQGETRFLFVMVKTEDSAINVEYSVDDTGLVTLISSVNFNGDIMISNLQGNCSSLMMTPYSINFGNYNEGKEDLIQYGLQYLELVTNTRIVLVDGLGIKREIETAGSTDVSAFEDGNYVVFIDSELIENKHLSVVTVLAKNSYLGIQKQIPTTGEEGQRCFVAFDKSYEFKNGGWRIKAFCPVGEFTIENRQITKSHTYPYNDNKININYNSHKLDYLFGSEIQGLNTTSTQTTFTVQPGKCVVGEKLINLNQSITKNIQNDWVEGDNVGGIISVDNPNQPYMVYEVANETNPSCFVTTEGAQNEVVGQEVIIYSDSQLTEEVVNDGTFIYTGNSMSVTKVEEGVVWLYVFIISNEYSIDILASRSLTPTIPDGYTYSRRLCSLPMKNGELLPIHQYSDMVYLDNWVTQDIQVENYFTTLNVDVPETSIKIIGNVELESNQLIQIKIYDGPIIKQEDSRFIQFEMPNEQQKIQIKGENPITAKLHLIGYSDMRVL